MSAQSFINAIGFHSVQVDDEPNQDGTVDVNIADATGSVKGQVFALADRHDMEADIPIDEMDLDNIDSLTFAPSEAF